MGFIETYVDLLKKKKNTEYEKIHVTSNGAFSMKSKDIFDNKEESLELIKTLRIAVKNYKQTAE